jgi:uncharacterized protein (TIGR00159 family)
MSRVWEAARVLLGEIGLTGLIDIAIMTVVIYVSLVWLKRTQRAALALTGLLIVTAVYLLARQFDLRLTVAVLQGFFAVILVALVVIFQEELRYVFERIAHFGLGRIKREAADRIEHEPVGILGRTLLDLARARIGALVVLPVHDPVARHLEGGEPLEGHVSEALLKSLFDPHSSGHDGALVIENGRITEFGCRLPLSRDSAQLAGRGTRHAAALGLAERTDAFCFVVSEERGTISLARHGRLQQLDGVEALHARLTEYTREVSPVAGPDGRGFLRRDNREKLIAVTLSLALWFVLVHESRMGYRTLRVPVELGQLPAGLVVDDVQPQSVEVTVSAPRRSLWFVSPADVRLSLRTWELEQGLRTLSIGPSDLTLPEGLTFENAKPRQVEVVLQPASPAF